MGKKSKPPAVQVPQEVQSPDTSVVTDNRRRRRRGGPSTQQTSLLTNGGDTGGPLGSLLTSNRTLG